MFCLIDLYAGYEVAMKKETNFGFNIFSCLNHEWEFTLK